MADLAPEQLDRLEYLAALKSGLDNEPDDERDATSSEMLRAVCLEFMDHATALVEAARKLEQVRALADDQGLPARFAITKIREVLRG